MNPEPTPTPREQTEMRLTALLMGELSAEETVALHALLAADPELAKLHARLRQAMALLREATAEPEPATPTPAQLSSERRERLLAHFKNPAPQPAKPALIVKPPRSVWSWVVRLGAAAAVVLILAGLFFPAIQPAKMSAKRSGQAQRELEALATAAAEQLRSDDEVAAATEPGALALTGPVAVFGAAPPNKPQATALYLPPTVDGSSGGEAPQIQLSGATIAKAGVYTGTLNFNDLNAPVTRDAVPPRPTHTADSKLNRMGGIGGMGMGVGIGGMGGTGGGTSYGPSGVTRQHPDLDNTLVGQEALAANARAVESPKPVEPAAPVIGDIPVLGNLFSNSSGAPPRDKAKIEPAPDLAGFDGFVNFGSALAQTPPGPAVPSTPMPQSGKDASDSSRLAVLPADGDKQIEIKAKNMEIAQNNLQELSFYDLAGGERAKAHLKTAADGTFRDEPSGPRRPADKEEGDKLKSSEAQKAPPPVEVGEPTLADAGDGSEFDADGEGPGAGNSEGEGSAEGAGKGAGAGVGEGAGQGKGKGKKPGRGNPPKSAGDPPDLAESYAKEGRTEIDGRGAEVNRKGHLGDTLARRNRSAAILNYVQPPPPPSAPMPVVKAEAAEEKPKEVAVQPRQPEELLKKIDEPVLLDREEKSGRDAIRIAEQRSRVSALKRQEEVLAKLKPEELPQALHALALEDSSAARASRAVGELSVEEKRLLNSGLGADHPSVKEVREKSARAQSESESTMKATRDKLAHASALEAEKLAVMEQRQAKDQPAKLEKKADQPAKAAEAQKAASMDEELPAARPAQPAAIPQPEVATSANAFSTFSLNVSDVSFKLAGASLEKGQMPELATVRSEEFINAFDYRDPEPAAGAPLAFATERARYPFAQNRDLVRFSVKTAAAGRQPGRPLNLVLLLDNSGSMVRADRVRILREALRVLAAQLQPQDRLSVVAFARTPRLWHDGVTGDKAGAAVARVGEITPQGGTNLEAALDLGYATALKHYQPGSISRVVLLTDGAANLGDVNPDALKQKVETNRQRGVALDCFGIGWEGYDDTLLETLARNGDGRYGFINTPEEAASGFAAQLAGALRVAASDVKVQVEWNPRRVTAYRQIGYAKHQLKKEQFRDNTVDAAEIGAAESGNALYVVEVNPRGEGDLATVRVRFKVPGTADYKEHEWAVPFAPTASSLEQASPALRLAGTASAFSEWLVASPYAAEVTTDRLLGLLNGVPAHYPADPRPKKLEWMIRTAKSVSGR